MMQAAFAHLLEDMVDTCAMGRSEKDLFVPCPCHLQKWSVSWMKQQIQVHNMVQMLHWAWEVAVGKHYSRMEHNQAGPCEHQCK